MVDGHNWNQIHRFLLRSGYRQVIDQTDGIISYVNGQGRRLTIIKSNNMSCEYLERILQQINVTYEEFVEEYQKAYATN